MKKYISAWLSIVIFLTLLPPATANQPARPVQESNEISQQLERALPIASVQEDLLEAPVELPPPPDEGNRQPEVPIFEPGPATVEESVYGADKSVEESVYQSLRMMAMSGYTPDPSIAAALGNINIRTPQAPYSIDSLQESISTLNGNLSIAAADLTLPGRNGLSFTLKRYYDASSANFYEADVYPYIFCVCKVIFDATQHTQRMYNGQIYDDPESYHTGRYHYSPVEVTDGTMNNLADAVGWSGFVNDHVGQMIYGPWSNPDQYGGQVRKATYVHQPPNVVFETGDFQMFLGWKNKANEKTYEEKLYPIGKGWMWNIPFIKTVEGKRYLNMQESGTYEISGSALKGYPFQDLSIAYDASVNVNGMTSHTVLKSMKGPYHYFDADGRLIQIADRYDNTIRFQYSQHPTYGKVLTGITDAIGNTINIAYHTDQVVLTQGNKTVRYNKFEYGAYDPLPPFRMLKTEMLSSVTDSMNRTTYYSYSVENAAFSLVGATPSHLNQTALLTTITHPTGAATSYAYGAPATRRIGEQAVQNVYRVASRKDVASGKTYNLRSFTYTNPQGYSTDYASSYGQDIPNFYVNVSDDLTTTVYDHRKKVASLHDTPQFYTNQVTATAGDEQRITTYQYDETRKIPYPIQTSTQFKKGSTVAPPVQTSVTYDNYGNVLTETNPLGVTTTYTYHPTLQLLSSITSPIQAGKTRYTEFLRNAQGSVTEMTVRNNGATGAILSRIKYENFDSHGNAGRTVIADDNRLIAYETEFGTAYQEAFPTKQSIATTNHAGQTEILTSELSYDANTGLILTSTDGRGAATHYQYDLADRLVRVTNPDNSYATAVYTDGYSQQVVMTDETGVKTRMRWDRLGNLLDEAVLDGSYRIMQSYGYDAYERLQWERDNQLHTTSYEYDAWSRLTKTIYPDNTFATEAYDELNRRQISTDPEGNQWRTTADVLGRAVLTEEWRDGQFRQTAAMGYDNEGNILSQTNATDTTTYTYDGLGRLTKVKDALNKEYVYSYSLAGLLQSILYPDGNQIWKDYDEAGRLIRQTNELGLTDRYGYDKAGNMTTHMDRKGQTFTYTYNNRNFLTSKAAPDETATYTYDLAGRRKTMNDATGTTGYQYKAATGELTQVTYPDNRYISYTYNSLGLRSTMRDPFSYMTYYTYDNRNRLTGAGASTTNRDVVYTYYANNLVKDITMSNGNQTWLTYKGLQLQTMRHQKADGTPLHTFSYAYDGNGNITNRSGTQAGTGFNENFTYDPLSRIQTASPFNESYTYDNRDNRATLQSEQLLSNLSLAERTYEYDSQNRLTKATVDGQEVRYRYNGDGLLYERTESGVTTRYYYDGSDVIAEGTVAVNGTAAFKARYVRGHGLAARQDVSGKAYYLHNGHGDVIELRDSTGNLPINRYTYDIWGNTLSATETVANPFRYSGELWDSTTELQYLRARWYDPSIGRFINKDTYEGELNNPLSLNLYTYTANNPLKYIDPSGHKVWLIHGTFSNDTTWTSEFQDYMYTLFQEKVQALNWTGGNSIDDREYAAIEFVSKILMWQVDHPSEPIRLVGHSHGGNVAILITNKLAELGMNVKTLITIATPIREYKLDTTVGQFIHVYNNFDVVQSSGGALKEGVIALKRKFDGAENVEVKLPWYRRNTSIYGISNHSYMHSNIEIWKYYIEEILKK